MIGVIGHLKVCSGNYGVQQKSTLEFGSVGTHRTSLEMRNLTDDLEKKLKQIDKQDFINLLVKAIHNREENVEDAQEDLMCCEKSYNQIIKMYRQYLSDSYNYDIKHYYDGETVTYKKFKRRQIGFRQGGK